VEYFIWCDESIKEGDIYSNFYGGAIVSSDDVAEIESALRTKKENLHMFQEVKWCKITENYQNKYIELIDSFFDFIAQGKIKVRIMFTDNAWVPKGLTNKQKENEYYILYYQFIKHSFGIDTIRLTSESTLRIQFDNLPHTKEKSREFKNFIFNLRRHFLASNMLLYSDGISEIDSKNHDILQCLDIILGSIAFRLNCRHLYIEPGKKRRGKRTRAKEQVYKHINKRIQQLYPESAFNIGVSTGPKNWTSPFWSMPYRHWVFKSRKAEYDESRKKRRPNTPYYGP
jgi:hypothetical protein